MTRLRLIPGQQVPGGWGPPEDLPDEPCESGGDSDKFEPPPPNSDDTCDRITNDPGRSKSGVSLLYSQGAWLLNQRVTLGVSIFQTQNL